MWRQLAESSTFDEAKGVQCFAVLLGAWASVNPVTVADAMSAQTPTVGAMSKYLGSENAVDVLAAIITDAAGLLNVGATLTAEQARATARILIEENKLMTIADWRACLRMGITGKFGRDGGLYGRLDISVISVWQSAYWELRLAEGERKSREQKAQAQKDGEKALSYLPPESVKAWLQKKIATLDKPAVPENIDQDPILRGYWKTEWEAIPDDQRPDFQDFVKIQKLKLKK